jgi:hypothetical protein
MGATDPMLAKLQALRLALQDPDTWSLKPLARLCQEAIDLRVAELSKPAAPVHTDPIIKKESVLWP